MNYYNEFDPKTAAWLRELIAAKLIPNGTVDERSIVDVRPDDLSGFTQCHFFAGIGGWSLALRLAGWPDDEPVWTGSCPCQPFSAAGKQLGTTDKRHLWPEFARLICECRPATVFGEQVASKPGREWLAGVFADLEDMGYAGAGADLCAAGVSAPHIRQRLYWVADLARHGWREGDKNTGRRDDRSGPPKSRPANCGDAGGMGYADDARLQGHRRPVELDDAEGRKTEERHDPASGFWGAYDLIGCADGKSRRIESGTFPLAHGFPGRVGLLRGYGNAIVPQVAASFIQAFVECRN